MRTFWDAHRALSWVVIGVVAVLLVGICVLALIDWNALRPTVARAISARTGREAAINGDLKVHVFSWTPSVEVNGFTLSNPSWAEKPLMFGASRLAASVSLGRLLRGQIVIPQITLVDPVINLERDADGHGSWEFSPSTQASKAKTRPTRIPTIRSLRVENGSLDVIDLVRKLSFSGSFVIAESATKADPNALRIRARGTLNTKPFTLEVDGGPLLNLTPDTPYSLAARVAAADIRLKSNITIRKPFDLAILDVAFTVSGADLADVFYLTGIALPNTPPYELSATVHQNGSHFDIEDLEGRLGTSDLEGKGAFDKDGPRPKLTGAIHSNTLSLVDLEPTLGTPAKPATAKPSLAEHDLAHRKTAPSHAQDAADANAPPSLLLPTSRLQVKRVRGMDADITYDAAAVLSPKIPMRTVHFHLILDDGLLTMKPLSFVLDAGQFAGTVELNARQTVPQSSIDMRIEHVDLGQFTAKAMKTPPLTGEASGRFKLQGTGDSIHSFASGANGEIGVLVPEGEINAAIAELTGIDVARGLGLLATKSDAKSAIRCSVIDFGVTERSACHPDFLHRHLRRPHQRSRRCPS